MGVEDRFGGRKNESNLITDEHDVKAFDVGQSESNDLPADQVAHLSESRPNKVDRQALRFLHGATGEACLLHPVEDGEGAGVEEGEITQLTLLVSRQLI